MHIIKCGSKDIKNVLGEAAREHKSKVGTIDSERTHLNYNLCPEENRVHSAEEAKKKIKALGVKRKIRENAVLAYSVIIDLPTDYTGDTRQFFESAYRALTQELCQGDENRVLQAYVHMDEKTPHMHFSSVPVIEKDGKIKLSAKEILGTKTKMKNFHPHIEQIMTEDLGIPVHLYDSKKVKEREEARAKGDRSKDYTTIEEYKARKEKEILAEELDKRLTELQEDLKYLNATYENTWESFGELNKELSEVNNKTKLAKEELSGIITQGRAQIAQMNEDIENTREYLGSVNEKAKKAKKELEEVNEDISQKKTLRDILNNAMANLFTRFHKAYIDIQEILEHWFNEEKKTYIAICELMREPVEKGNEAINVLDNAMQMITQKKTLTREEERAVNKAHQDLEEATEELEEIEDEFELEI